MPDDGEPGFFSARPKILILIGAVTGSTLMVAGIALWFGLPRWAPAFVVAESPWVGPAFDAAMREGGGLVTDFRYRVPDWGEAVIPAMCSALSSRDPKRRALAASILASKKDKRSVGPLIDALDDPEPAVLAQVISALAEIGDPRASAPLIARVPSFKEFDDAVGVAMIIGRLAHPDLFAQVSTTLLASSQPQMQALGCLALHGSSDPRALKVLEDKLGKVVFLDKEWPGYALGISKQPEALAVIRRVLSDPDPDHRFGAAIAARQNHHVSLLEPLIGLTTDPVLKVRRVAARALGAYLQESAIAALGRMIEVGDEAAISAVGALGRNGSPAAIPMMLTHLSHPKVGIRIALVEWLCGKSKLSPSEIESILQLLTDVDPGVVEKLKACAHQLPLTPAQKEKVSEAGQKPAQ